MRARYPDAEGFVERDGVKVGYEMFGSGEPAIVFAPTDPLVHSRAWKAQVPYLARTSRVVTIDPRGNGRSDRPRSSAAYADTEYVADTIAVMDAVGVDRAVLVGLCSSAWTSLLAAVLHPDRVLGVVSIATWAPFLTPPSAVRAVYDFDQACDTDEGWAKDDRHYWLRDWRGYAEFFFGELRRAPATSATGTCQVLVVDWPGVKAIAAGYAGSCAAGMAAAADGSGDGGLPCGRPAGMTA